MIITCPPVGCKTINTSACIFYEGPSLLFTGISTNDSVEIVIQKFDSYLQGIIPGIGSGQISFEKDVFQIAHGFIIGDAIRHDGAIWVKAQADVLANSGTVGIISVIFDTNNFTYQFGGHLLVGGPWSDGVSYFLAINMAGGIVPEELYPGVEIREFIGTGTPDGLLIELDLGDQYGDVTSPGGGPLNTITNYRSSFEEVDGKIYAGYFFNGTITITRTIDGILENAINLTNLEADWTNRLNLTYI